MMKKFLVVFLMLVSGYAIAQPANYIPYASRNRYIALMADSTFHIPRFNGSPSLRTGGSTNDGALAADTANGRLYMYYNGAWSLINKDTSNTFLNSLYKKTGTDSVFQIKGGTHTFAFTVGGSSGGVSRVGPVDSTGASANGAQISGSTIWFNTFNTENYGVVPPSTGTTTDFLRADGTWAAPPGGGGLGTLDTLKYPKWDVVQDDGGTSYKAHRNGRFYNVKDFGAKGDSTTNDQAAIQAAIDTCFANGGGVVFFPNGYYNLNGSFNGTTNSLLTIPVTGITGEGISIQLLGETPPAVTYSGLIDYPINRNGVVIFTNKIGSGTKPSLLSSYYEYSGFSNLNSTDLFIENINFRNRSKTSGGSDTVNTMYGLNLSVIGNLSLKNVRVDIQSDIYRSSQPLSGTTGIVFPGLSNSAFVTAEDILVTGYDIGINVNEHFNGRNITVSGNNYGVYSATGGHSIYFDKLIAQWNKKNIVLDGTTYIKVALLSTEHYKGAYGSRWYEFEHDVYQASGTPKIDITHLTAVSGTGVVAGDFTTNMTSNINAATIGGSVSGYVQNTFGISTQQANSGFNVSDTAIIGKNLGIGPIAKNDIKGTVYIRTASDTRVSVNKTSSAFTGFMAASSIANVFFDKSRTFGLYAADSIMDDGGVTGQYVFVANGTTKNTYFGGVNYNSSPEAKITIAAPSSTANTGQIKLISGTIPSTPEAGMINFSNGQFIIDSSNAKRDTIATRDWARKNFTNGGGGGGGSSPAGNFGNIQLNRNGGFATPSSDSLDYENGTGLLVKNRITSYVPAENNNMTLGTASGGINMLNPTGIYGLFMGVANSGNTWIQSGRNDGNTSAYNISMQSQGGEVLIGTSTDAGAYKLQVSGDMYTNGIIYQVNGTNFTNLVTGASLNIFQYSNTKKFGVQAATSISDAGSTGTYNFIADGATGNTLFGNVAYNAAAATAKIHIAAGSATAGTAPLKFTSGTNLTTAEAGAMEYNGTNLFFTRTGTTRENVLTTASVNSVSPTSPNRTITVVIDGTTYYIHAKTTND